MNKYRKKRIPIYFLLAAVLFYVSAAIGFFSKTESSMPIIYLCLGSCFVCLSTVFNKKSKDDDENKED